MEPLPQVAGSDSIQQPLAPTAKDSPAAIEGLTAQAALLAIAGKPPQQHAPAPHTYLDTML